MRAELQNQNFEAFKNTNLKKEIWIPQAIVGSPKDLGARWIYGKSLGEPTIGLCIVKPA
jgi:hypothetical protein